VGPEEKVLGPKFRGSKGHPLTRRHNHKGEGETSLFQADGRKDVWDAKEKAEELAEPDKKVANRVLTFERRGQILTAPETRLGQRLRIEGTRYIDQKESRFGEQLELGDLESERERKEVLSC